jgi:hypothetical protein
MQYQVIEVKSRSVLEFEVNALLKNGWSLQGGVNVIERTEYEFVRGVAEKAPVATGASFLYMQALSKPIESGGRRKTRRRSTHRKN